MKTIQYTIISFAIAVATSLGSSAQDLNKEISIDKDIVPEMKESDRIYSSPTVPQMKIKNVKLNYNEKAKVTDVVSSIVMLDAAENIDTMKISPYKGYAMLGYFPVYNLDFSAGYRFIDNEKMKLNAWAQYNGLSYDATPRSGKEMSLYDHEVTLDVNYAQRINNKSILKLNADYSYNHFSCPWWGSDYTQNVNQFNIGGKWYSSIDGLKYNVDARYNYFGYGKDANYNLTKYEHSGSGFDAVKEHNVNVNAGASLEIADDASVALDLGVAIAHDNHFLKPSWGLWNENSHWHGYKDNDGYTHSILTLIPHYDFKWRDVTAKIGARVDLQLDIDTEINFAPDVYVNWDATKFISAYARFAGGVYQNTLSSVFDESHYFMSSVAYGNSKLPFVIDAGVYLGPFKNATIEVFGGYAHANDWLMPIVIKENEHLMDEVDLKGWHVGVAASYRYKNWGKMRVSYEMAPQSHDKGYYMWRDQAKHVVKASAVITPIAPLDVTLDYEYRGSRCSYKQSVIYNQPQNELYPSYSRLSLGQMNNLSIGGLYRYTDQISFFARLENILNRKYDLLYDIPSQGFTGLVGATYKF